MTCETCNGRGKVWHEGSIAQFMETCDDCKGTGERPAPATPQPAPTTGAEETIFDLIRRYGRLCASEVAAMEMASGREVEKYGKQAETCMVEIKARLAATTVSAAAVPDAETMGAINGLHELVKDAVSRGALSANELSEFVTPAQSILIVQFLEAHDALQETTP